MRGQQAQVETTLRVIYLLAQLKAPASCRQIAMILNIPGAKAVRPLLNQWREFLAESRTEEEARYRIYHDSFANFLAEQDEIIDVTPEATEEPLRLSRSIDASRRLQDFVNSELFGER